MAQGPPKGSQFWKLRTSHNCRPLKLKTPEIMWELCCEYFEAVEANPLIEVKPYVVNGEVEMVEIPKLRPMTIGGLLNFLGICHQTWRTYRERDGYEETAEKVDRVIREQKFAGAAAGFFNPMIICRDLGLRDGVDHSSEDGSMTPPRKIELVAATSDDSPD